MGYRGNASRRNFILLPQFLSRYIISNDTKKFENKYQRAIDLVLLRTYVMKFLIWTIKHVVYVPRKLLLQQVAWNKVAIFNKALRSFQPELAGMIQTSSTPGVCKATWPRLQKKGAYSCHSIGEAMCPLQHFLGGTIKYYSVGYEFFAFFSSPS